MCCSRRPIFLVAVLSLVGLGFVVLSLPLARAADEEEWKAPARAAKKKNPFPADEKSLAAGKAAYAKECLSCHGETGKGDGTASKDLNPKPRNLSDPKIAEQTDGALFWKITEGRKPMPSSENTLTEDQRWHVVNYIRTQFMPKSTSQP